MAFDASSASALQALPGSSPSVTTPSVLASTRVFNIPELVEAILCQVTADVHHQPASNQPDIPGWPAWIPPKFYPDVKFLFSAIRITKMFQRTIAESQELRMRMFLQYRVPPEEEDEAAQEELNNQPDYWEWQEILEEQKGICEGDLDRLYWLSDDEHDEGQQQYSDESEEDEEEAVRRAQEEEAHQQEVRMWRDLTYVSLPNPLLLPGPQQLPLLRIFDVSWWPDWYEYRGTIFQLSAPLRLLKAWANEPWKPTGASWEGMYLTDQANMVRVQVNCNHGHNKDNRDNLDVFYQWGHEEKLGNIVKWMKQEIAREDLDKLVRERARQCAARGTPVRCRCELCRPVEVAS